MDDQIEPEPNRFTARCLHCQEVGAYVPTGGRLTLYSHGWMILEFWCLSCYEHNAQRIMEVDFAESISNLGVPTRLMTVPMEMMEHPDHGEPINEVDVRGIERVNLTYFQERVNRESKSWQL